MRKQFEGGSFLASHPWGEGIWRIHLHVARPSHPNCTRHQARHFCELASPVLSRCRKATTPSHDLGQMCTWACGEQQHYCFLAAFVRTVWCSRTRQWSPVVLTCMIPPIIAAQHVSKCWASISLLFSPPSNNHGERKGLEDYLPFGEASCPLPGCWKEGILLFNSAYLDCEAQLTSTLTTSRREAQPSESHGRNNILASAKPGKKK